VPVESPHETRLPAVVDTLAIGVLLGVPISILHAAWILGQQRYLTLGLYRLAGIVLAETLLSTSLLVAATVAAVRLLHGFESAERRSRPIPLMCLVGGAMLLAPAASALWRLIGPQLALVRQEGLEWSFVAQRFAGASAFWLTALICLLALSVWLRRRRSRPRGSNKRKLRRSLAKPATLVGVPALVFVMAVQAERRLPPRGESPNVVVIAIDTLRADHLDLYDYPRVTAPHLRRLARDAVTFENASSTAPWTTPALASALTGRYPARFGYRDQPSPLGPGALLLAEALRDRKYRTAAIVANLYGSAVLGFDQGFESFDQREALGYDHISSQALSDRAIARLDDLAPGPFLLYLLYFDPHFGYAQHPEFDFDPDYEGDLPPLLDIFALRARARGLDSRDREHLAALYDSEIRFTDEHLGRLIDALQERDLYDDTLLIVFGDHGEELADRSNWIGHTSTLWEQVLHVPLLVKFPGNRGAGTLVRTPVSIVDVAPTALAAAGVEPRDLLDGIALSPEGAPLRGLVAETRRIGNLRSLRWGPWKLIRDLATGSQQLFHLEDDPAETIDLATSNPERTRELADLLTDWEKRVTSSPSDDAGPAAFSEQQLEQLRALGYVD
jgi:arylsulfatase A-like enzyme